MPRKRLTYFSLTLVTIVLGLLSRKGLTPAFIAPYLGDYLYAVMIFFIVGFLFPRVNSLILAITSILICYTIEISQLYQADWINSIRSSRLGALVLGRGFLWSDLVSYTAGGLTGYCLELTQISRRIKSPH